MPDELYRPRARGPFRWTAQKLLTLPWVLDGAAALSGGFATILLLHRFSDRPDDAHGTRIDELSRRLAWLRLHRYRLVDLGTLVDDLREGRPILPRTVAFTVDDGHADFHDLASPVFRQFDCPVSVFLTTDFIDRRQWLWWDIIQYAVCQSPQTSCQIRLEGRVYSASWGNGVSRLQGAVRLAEQVKWLPAARRNAAIGRIVEALEVEVPSQPPERFAPMSWEQIRALAGAGVSFGPHSATHPILALEDEATVRMEIGRSWTRLREVLPGALPIFCYPNGNAPSFGAREERIVADLGLHASLSAIPAQVRADHFSSAGDSCGSLPRFPMEQEPERFTQIVSGLERIKGRFLRR